MFDFLGAHETNGLLNLFSWGMFLELVVFFFGVFFIGYLLLEQPTKGLGSLLHSQ